MEYLLRFGLPIYFLFYFGIAFVGKSISIYRKIGKNPIVLPNEDTAHGLLGLYFKLSTGGLLLYFIVLAFFPHIYDRILPIQSLEFRQAQIIGVLILLMSILWTVIAQYQMKESWRIGIDTETPTALITNGLFKISRNPIFLGMLASMIGLFLATPNFVTLLVLILAYVLIQIQIRLEEEFLLQQHGEAYEMFKENTRRLI